MSPNVPQRLESLDDTGWIGLTVGAGWNIGVAPAWRVKHGVFYMKGYISRITPANTDLTIGTLPLEITRYLGQTLGRGWNAGAGSASVYIQPDVVLRSAYTTSAHVDFFLNGVIFPLDQSLK